MRLEESGTDTEHGVPAPNPMPFLVLAPITRDILTNAHRLPDGELLRIAGCLRSMADEVMAVVDRRLGSRPAPHLVIDNTRHDPHR